MIITAKEFITAAAKAQIKTYTQDEETTDGTTYTTVVREIEIEDPAATVRHFFYGSHPAGRPQEMKILEDAGGMTLYEYEMQPVLDDDNDPMEDRELYWLLHEETDIDRIEYPCE